MTLVNSLQFICFFNTVEGAVIHNECGRLVMVSYLSHHTLRTTSAHSMINPLTIYLLFIVEELLVVIGAFYQSKNLQTRCICHKNLKKARHFASWLWKSQPHFWGEPLLVEWPTWEIHASPGAKKPCPSGVKSSAGSPKHWTKRNRDIRKGKEIHGILLLNVRVHGSEIR